MTFTPAQASQYSTPQEHIDAVRELAAKIEVADGISGCIVDDWGRFSNFQIIVDVDSPVFRNTNKGILTRKINAMIDKALKDTGAHRRSTHAPEARRVWCSYDQKKKITGYNRTYWMVDIDFHNFDAANNSFDNTTINSNLRAV